MRLRTQTHATTPIIISPTTIPTPNPIIRGFNVASAGCFERCSDVETLGSRVLFEDGVVPFKDELVALVTPAVVFVAIYFVAIVLELLGFVDISLNMVVGSLDDPEGVMTVLGVVGDSAIVDVFLVSGFELLLNAVEYTVDDGVDHAVSTVTVQ